MDSINGNSGAVVQQEPQRLTPCKFTVDHCTASLANGVLVCVKPQFSQGDYTNVVKVLNFGMEF